MRICDLQEDQVVVGLQIRSLVDPMRIGTIVDIDYVDDASAWIRWEGETDVYSSFYGNNCKCEVVCDQFGKLIVVEGKEMIRWIIGILAIMVLAAIVGADCLTCGQGDQIRSNIKHLFNSNGKSEPMRGVRP